MSADGVRIALRHLDAWTGVVAQLWGGGGFVDDASVWRGTLTLLVWLVSAAVALRASAPARCDRSTSSSPSPSPSARSPPPASSAARGTT